MTEHVFIKEQAIDPTAEAAANYESLASNSKDVDEALEPFSSQERVAVRKATTEDVVEVIERVGRGLEATKPDLQGEPLMQLTLLAKRMRQLDEIHTALDVVRKTLNAEYDHIKLKALPDLMNELELRTFTVEGAGRVQIGGDVYASISADQKDGAYQWLRDNNYGDLIVETVNASTLKAWCKEGLEQGRDMPEELFKITPYTRATLVKVKPSKKKA